MGNANVPAHVVRIQTALKAMSVLMGNANVPTTVVRIQTALKAMSVLMGNANVPPIVVRIQTALLARPALMVFALVLRPSPHPRPPRLLVSMIVAVTQTVRGGMCAWTVTVRFHAPRTANVKGSMLSATSQLMTTASTAARLGFVRTVVRMKPTVPNLILSALAFTAVVLVLQG